jgi:3-deoxy-D-arabino-heptulosonate 7-phosphate (DAHP) synthase class II
MKVLSESQSNTYRGAEERCLTVETAYGKRFISFNEFAGGYTVSTGSDIEFTGKNVSECLTSIKATEKLYIKKHGKPV